MITQTFDLNLIPDSAPVVVHCDQYDKGTGRLVINLYDGAIAYSPSGTAVIQGTKPDGRGFDYSCSLSGNVVTANLTEQMTAVAGQVRTQIVVTESTGRTGTFVFILDVQRSALPADTDMSESDYQLIEQAIEETQQAAEDAEAWAVGERGGVPVTSGDETYNNNSKYWADVASQYAQGGLHYSGTCLFANIPTTGMTDGDMWNIEDDFITDSRFQEGSGIAVAAGSNIAWNTNNKWDVLAMVKVSSLNDLTNVDITSPSANDFLGYDPQSSEWKNIPISIAPMTASTLGIGKPDTITTTVDGTGTFSAKGVGIVADVNSGGTQYGADWLYYTGTTTVITPESDKMYRVTISGTAYLYYWNGTAYTMLASQGGGGGASLVDVTTAQYNALTPQEKADATKWYWINDMPAIAHQNKILSNTSGGGSTILVTTSESTLYGQTVTLSDGTTTMSGTFSNTGECEFTGVMMTGTLTATSSTASTSINVPYFGVYSMTLSFFSATITATFPSGATCICVGNGETYTASTSPHTFTVHGAATYTVGATIDGASKQTSVVISTDGQTASVAIEFGTIVLTYDNDFRGKTITCTKGGAQTITKTAPSSGNTMYFYPPTTGNWTISGTVSSDTYYSSPNPVVVSSLSTSVSATLETIPDGSTKTPTDDVSIWLSCAGIRDKSYTTLSQVLSDSETFNALLGDSNACAYMARSTTWAVATGQVPQMTSATTPSGVVSTNKQITNYEAWKAFNSSETNGWFATSGVGYSTGDYLEYEFPNAVKINKASISYNFQSSANTIYFKIQGYNGSSWDDYSSEVTLSGSSGIISTNVILDSQFYGTRIRLYISTNSTNSNGIGMKVQFYSADVTLADNQYAMSMIGQYDVCSLALLGNATWASAIINSSYADYVITASVPLMTSNSAPSGVVTASSYLDNQDAWAPYRAFHYKPITNTSVDNRGWLAQSGTSDAWIKYEFPQAVVIKVWQIYSRYGTGEKTFSLYGSNDDSNYTPLDTQTASYDDVKVWSFSNDTAYKYYKVIVQGAVDTTTSGLRFQFCGRADSSELIHGTNNEVAYYLDGATQTPIVDPSTLSAGTYTFGSTVAKDPSDLTADYTKTIRITPNTKEIVLRPDCALYWYGYRNPAFEIANAVNAVPFGGTFVNPTFDNYSVTIGDGVSGHACGLILNKLTSISKVYALIKGITAQSGSYGQLDTFLSNAGSQSTSVDSTTLKYYEISDTNLVRIIVDAYSRSMEVSTVFYE